MSGIAPGAVYGCDHRFMEHGDVGKLRRQAAAVLPVRPMAVPTGLRLLTLPTASDPGFRRAWLPIAR